jgi:Putative Flp pilus-assembly TadE/G-like
MSKRTRVRTPGEQGQVLVWTVILLPLLLALVGLVFDGGLLWVQFRRARWAADGAAVAAASEINPALYANKGQVKLDIGPSAGTAVHYAQVNDPDLHLTALYFQANSVRVKGWVEVRPVFLSLFGVGPLRLDITGQERPAWGVASPGQ